MKFFLVREDILPESILRAVRAKEMLLRGEVSTVNEAVEKVNLSRSAYYKYRDRVFTFHSHIDSKDITIYMTLEHRSGVLSNVLNLIASLKGNIITIKQELPVQGLASVCICLDISNLSGDIDTILEEARKIDGVKTVSLQDIKNVV
ncbi:MAG: ACT domain-containing protein [Bacillota bacterium]